MCNLAWLMLATDVSIDEMVASWSCVVLLSGGEGESCRREQGEREVVGR